MVVLARPHLCVHKVSKRALWQEALEPWSQMSVEAGLLEPSGQPSFTLLWIAGSKPSQLENRSIVVLKIGLVGGEGCVAVERANAHDASIQRHEVDA